VGTILHWDGQEWTDHSFPTVFDLTSISMLSAAEGWAVGEAGKTLHWDGRAWQEIFSGTGNDLFAVDEIAPDDVWAVGFEVHHWDGQSWQYMPDPTSNWLAAIEMLSPTDGWVVGGFAFSECTILRWNGVKWKEVACPVNEELMDIAMLSDGWLGGWSRGPLCTGMAILVAGGRTWRELPVGIDMVSPTDGWAVGNGQLAKASCCTGTARPGRRCPPDHRMGERCRLLSPLKWLGGQGMRHFITLFRHEFESFLPLIEK
jgi:hypothetical protein